MNPIPNPPLIPLNTAEEIELKKEISPEEHFSKINLSLRTHFIIKRDNISIYNLVESMVNKNWLQRCDCYSDVKCVKYKITENALDYIYENYLTP